MAAGIVVACGGHKVGQALHVGRGLDEVGHSCRAVAVEDVAVERAQGDEPLALAKAHDKCVEGGSAVRHLRAEGGTCDTEGRALEQAAGHGGRVVERGLGHHARCILAIGKIHGRERGEPGPLEGAGCLEHRIGIGGLHIAVAQAVDFAAGQLRGLEACHAVGIGIGYGTCLLQLTVVVAGCVGRCG